MYAIGRPYASGRVYRRIGDRWHLLTHKGWETAARKFHNPTQFNYFRSALEVMEVCGNVPRLPLASFCLFI